MQYKIAVKWIFDLFSHLKQRVLFPQLKQIGIFCKSHCFEHISLKKNVDVLVIVFSDFVSFALQFLGAFWKLTAAFCCMNDNKMVFSS